MTAPVFEAYWSGYASHSSSVCAKWYKIVFSFLPKSTDRAFFKTYFLNMSLTLNLLLQKIKVLSNPLKISYAIDFKKCLLLLGKLSVWEVI